MTKTNLKLELNCLFKAKIELNIIVLKILESWQLWCWFRWCDLFKSDITGQVHDQQQDLYETNLMWKVYISCFIVLHSPWQATLNNHRQFNRMKYKTLPTPDYISITLVSCYGQFLRTAYSYNWLLKNLLNLCSLSTRIAIYINFPLGYLEVNYSYLKVNCFFYL